MNDDIVMKLPHKLGRDEVFRRLRQAVGQIEQNYGKVVVLSDVKWAEDRVNFAASALGQTLRGELEVQEDYVELRASLPFLLRLFSRRVTSEIRDNGVKLLK